MTVLNEMGALRLLVATGPNLDGEMLQHDLDVLRPAVLFADEVVLVSPAAWMVFGIAAEVSQEDPVVRAQVLGSLASVTDAKLPAELSAMLAGIAQTNRLLAHGNRHQRRALKKVLGGHEDDLRRMGGMIDAEYTRLCDHVYDTMFHGHPAEELTEAIDRGVVTLDGLGVQHEGDLDDVMDRWWSRVRDALTDAGTFLLFDRQVAGLIRAHVAGNALAVPDLATLQQRQSGLAAGFLTRLPTLRQAPIAEILDFREDVGAEVAAYRAATAEMASIIAEPAHSEDFDAVVNNRWINEVQPALRAIEDRARQVGLLQRMGDVASASGLQLGGLLAGAFTAASVAGWAAAAPAVAAAGAKYAWDVHRASAATRDELRGHRFILLHDVGEQLAS